MPLDATYHRTFLPDGPFEPVTCTPGCHRDNNPAGRLDASGLQFVRQPQRDPAVERFTRDGYGTPPVAEKPRVHFRTQKRHAAFLIAGKELRPIFIVDKLDQKFADVATAWEKEFSALVKDGPGRFTPLVDHDLTVVGHVGTVEGGKLIKVKGAAIGSQYRGAIASFIAADEPIYASAAVPDGWEAFNTLPPVSIYTVVTDIFGEVTSGDVTDTKSGAIATEGPVEYITLAVGVLALAALVVRGVVRSIVSRRLRSAGVKAAAGPTKQIAEEVIVSRAAAQARNASRSVYREITGITPEHHKAFLAAANETKLIIVVRHTNPKSIRLIEKRCPGKPKDLEFINTSPDTGIVMAIKADEVQRAQRLGYYVVGDGKKATRLVMRDGKEVAEDLSLPSSFWQLEKGQVIHPDLKKPIVGDYDLMGVIDPNKPADILAVVVRNYEAVADVTNATVQKAAAALNSRFDMPRVLHGAQDLYKGFRKGASAYFPDGTVLHFDTEDAVQAFYATMKRQPRAGMHPRPAPGTPVKDDLKAVRERNANKPTGWR